MKRIIIFLILCSPCYAQLWSGVLAPARAMDWTHAGVVGGIPSATWTQCGSTISSGASAATINAALAACTANHYVQLGAGTFPGGLTITVNGTALRGMGADQTTIQGATTSTCPGGFGFSGMVSACTAGANHNIGDGTAFNWTGGYAQGATLLTFSATTGLSAGQMLFLDQCDDGFSGSGCATGAYTDNGNMEVCTINCSSEGSGTNAYRNNRSQIQIVIPTNVTTSTVTIPSPGLYAPNWRSGQTPGAWGPFTPLQNVGVENLTIDERTSNANQGFMAWGTYGAWSSGVRYIMGTSSKSAIIGIMSAHFTFQNNYIYGNQARPNDPYPIQLQITADGLIVNNIIQQGVSPIVFNGPDSGTVIAYNFTILNNAGSQGSWSFWNHSSGVAYQLWEGNEINGFANDNIHGSHNMTTRFRNWSNGKESTNTQQVNPSFDAAFNRYTSMVANVLGNPALDTVYESNDCCNPSNQIFVVGWGNTIPDDSITNTTMMRWGNWDVVTGATRFCTANVTPLSACTADERGDSGPVYPGLTSPSTTFAPSWYYASKPSWWNSEPWPNIGPDVTGGPISNTGGHVYNNPAADCYLNIMGGPAAGTGSFLTFNANTCYPSGNTPPPPAPASNMFVKLSRIERNKNEATIADSILADRISRVRPPSYASAAAADQ